jgi:hypothetical protein
MRGPVLMMLSLLLQPSPASELHAAHQDLLALPPTERIHVRYLTLYAVPPERREDLRDTANFWLNSLSRRPTMTRSTRVTETVLRFDLRDYAISPTAWESLASGRGYEFKPLWQSTAKTTADPIATVTPLLRADSWLTYVSDHPFYTEWLSLPGTLDKLFEDQRIRPDDVKALRLELAGAKLRSGVALHNRRLVRWPTLAGYFWKSEDHLTDFGADSVVENLLTSDVDAGEFIWSLPNGLQAYFIAGRDGKLARVVPADIAQDYETPARDKQIYNARSCVGCHAAGINKFSDDISGMIEREKVELRSRDKAKALEIEDRYLGDLAGVIDQDNAKFQAAARAACGRTSEQIATLMTRFVVEYREGLINAEVAARELGVPLEKLSELAIAYGPEHVARGTFAALLAGQSIPRQAWEAVIGEAIFVLAGKRTAPVAAKPKVPALRREP